MSTPALEVMIPITLFAAIFGIVYVYFQTRHRERLKMLEKGVDPSLFQRPISYRRSSLRIGMFLIGLALGILFGNILAETTPLKEEIAYFSMIFLFGGTSLVLFHVISKKPDNE
jgi:hypothetical protein